MSIRLQMLQHHASANMRPVFSDQTILTAPIIIALKVLQDIILIIIITIAILRVVPGIAQITVLIAIQETAAKAITMAEATIAISEEEGVMRPAHPDNS